ncbi:FERM domain-containing protein 5 [Lamellibrachia satsuma]|nr:FERM domain-containing protein 5 [Lamellibrachia satsuma]
MFRNRFRRKKSQPKCYEDIHHSCTVRFLDDSEPITVTFQKETKGQWLLQHVCQELNLVESDYFGLRYVDSEKQRHWLDPFKPVYKQLKNVNPLVLCFRVKFYPTDPKKLKEEITRYFLFLQLRRDLHHGRLLCGPADANLLAAYIVQSELGDYDPQDHLPGYVSQFKMLPKQTQKQEEKIAEIHQTLTSQVPAEAEENFLKKACTLDTYGVDPHPVKDQKGNQMYLGVTHLGIVTFQGNKRTHLFKWPSITKIAFEGKMFIVHVTMSDTIKAFCKDDSVDDDNVDDIDDNVDDDDDNVDGIDDNVVDDNDDGIDGNDDDDNIDDDNDDGIDDNEDNDDDDDDDDNDDGGDGGYGFIA